VDFDRKKLELVAGTLVEPVNGCPVLVGEFPRHPYYNLCFTSGSVGKQLAEMSMVAPLYLVFDSHIASTRTFFFG
jgi:hypothetical protein